MILHRLQLEAFRHIAHADILLQPGLTLVVGANGAGKSTLLEAIVWTLYGAGAVRRSEQSLLTDDATRVMATLDLGIGTDVHRVTRALERGAASSAASGSAPALPPRDMFMRACVTGRRELQQLTQLTPEERMGALGRLLGSRGPVARMRPRGIVAAAVRTLAEEIDAAERRLDALASAPDLLTQYGAELEQARADLAEAEAHAARLHDEWAQKRQDVQTRLDAHRRRGDDLRRQIERLSAAGPAGACPTCDHSLGNGIERVISRLDDEFYITAQDVKWLAQRLAQLERRPPDVAEADTKRERLRALVADRAERAARCEQAVQELWSVAQERQRARERLDSLHEQMSGETSQHDVDEVARRAGAFVSRVAPEYTSIELTREGHVYGLRGAARAPLVSGGDEDLFALALRIAASRMAAERAGMDGPLLLDEPFGALDADRRRALIAALRELAPAPSAIVITTQDGSLRDCADHVIEMMCDDAGRASVRQLVRASAPEPA